MAALLFSASHCAVLWIVIERQKSPPPPPQQRRIPRVDAEAVREESDALEAEAADRWEEQGKADQDGLPWRDDRRDLAHDFDFLAQQVADYIAVRAAERPAIEAANFEAARKDPEWTLNEDETRESATDYSDKVSKTQYLLTWQPKALALFDKAVEEGRSRPTRGGSSRLPRITPS